MTARPATIEQGAAHRVTRGFAWNHLYKMVEYGGVNLYAILVVRTFGPETGGNYAVYLSITGTLGILATFAVDGILLRYLPLIARGESEYGTMKIEGVRPFLIQLFAFRVLVTLVLCALVAVGLGMLPHWIPTLTATLGHIQQLWPYLILFLLGQSVVGFGTFTLIGLLQVKWVFYASLLTRGVLLAIGFGLVYARGLSLEWAVGLHAGATVINGALLFYWVYHHVEHIGSAGLRRELAQFASHLTTFIRKPGYLRVFLVLPFMLYGMTTWGSSVLTTVLGRQPDILMMRAILGENVRDIGLYEAATRLVLMTEYIFLFGLGGTLVTVFSMLVHRDDEEWQNGGKASDGKRYPRLFQARREIAGFQSVSTAPLIAFMIVFAPLVIEAVYGARFAGAVPMVMVGLWVLALTVIGFGGGMQVTSLVVIGRERVVFVNRLSWGIINLIANYFLIQKMGGLGAMFGTQLANSGACIMESYFAWKWIGPSFHLRRTTAIVSIVSVAAMAGYLVVYVWMSDGAALFARLGAGLMTVMGLSLAGYIVFRIPEAHHVFQKMRSLRGKKDSRSLTIE